MAPRPRSWYNLGPAANPPRTTIQPPVFGAHFMTKPHRRLKKANHGARPANSKARKAKRKHIRT